MSILLFDLNLHIPIGNNILDAGYSSESILITVPVNLTDTGTSTDTVTHANLPLTSTIPVADNGTGTDLISIVRTVTDPITLEGNRLSPDVYLELFDFDASYIGGSSMHYTNTPTGGGIAPLLWRGNSYYPIPFEITGIDNRGDGTVSGKPQIVVTNINKFFMAAIGVLGDLTGTRITRWRTFYKFTDSGLQADINMHYPVDVWIMTRLIGQSKNGIQYELSSPLDRPGLKLPRKQILRDLGFPGVGLARPA
jgi:lambda family phage minor tail protein L